jgi:hypothetical protein
MVYRDWPIFSRRNPCLSDLFLARHLGGFTPLRGLLGGGLQEITEDAFQRAKRGVFGKQIARTAACTADQPTFPGFELPRNNVPMIKGYKLVLVNQPANTLPVAPVNTNEAIFEQDATCSQVHEFVVQRIECHSVGEAAVNDQYLATGGLSATGRSPSRYLIKLAGRLLSVWVRDQLRNRQNPSTKAHQFSNSRLLLNGQDCK